MLLNYFYLQKKNILQTTFQLLEIELHLEYLFCLTIIYFYNNTAYTARYYPTYDYNNI